jgi:hypothetical protein
VRVLKPAIELAADKKYNGGAREILSDATSYYLSMESTNEFGYKLIPLVLIKRNNVNCESDEGSVILNLDNQTSIYLNNFTRNTYCSGYYLTIDSKVCDDLRDESDVKGAILLGMFLAYVRYLKVDMKLLECIKAGYNLKLAPGEIVVLDYFKVIKSISNDDLGWLFSTVECKMIEKLTFVLKREGLSTSSGVSKSKSKSHDFDREIEIGSKTEITDELDDRGM